jgi:hypothetical protein
MSLCVGIECMLWETGTLANTQELHGIRDMPVNKGFTKGSWTVKPVLTAV